MNKAKRERFKAATRVLLGHYKRILRRKGVTGVDVGFRIEDDGTRTDEVTIRIHVEEKISKEELHPNQVFEKELGGVPVTVIERQRYRPLSSPTTGSSPTAVDRPLNLQPGSALRADHNWDEFGTLGMVVEKVDARGARHPRLLTNAHVVLAGKKKSELPAGAKVVQKRNGKRKTVGRIVNVADSVYLNSFVDCALVTPVDEALLHKTLQGISPQPACFRDLTYDDIDKVVYKVGAKTKLRSGVIDSISQIFSVPGNTFLMQVSIIPERGQPVFAKGGDSGSVVVLDGAVVALLHGVDETGQIAIASPIGEVLREMPFQMMEQEC